MLLNQPLLQGLTCSGDMILIGLFKVYSLLKNVLPGVTALHAKIRRPARDCNSLNVTFSVLRNSWILFWHFWSLTWGSLTFTFWVSRTIPRNSKQVVGQTFFLDWMGMFTSLAKYIKLVKCFEQSALLGGPIKRKSSSTCTTFASNFVSNIQWIAELKDSEFYNC